MPILDDIMDHEVIGRERKFGMKLGREEGRREGEFEGQRKVILRLIAKRFGAVPDWANIRIQSLDEPELEKIELQPLDATILEQLFS